MKHMWFPILVVLVFGIGCDPGLTETSQEQGVGQQVAFQKNRPTIGAPAEEFKLIDLEGKWLSLADYKGKVVLLNFWATWCGPCRVEMPSMEVLYQDLKEQGFEILAISSDHQGSIITRPFVQAKALTFPILHDADYRVSGTYGIRTLPMSYLIDRQGTLRHRVFGARDWNSLEARELIQELLETS
ncbi:MAG: TlpA disulfide reductase family protein [Nitrospirae bacterium]|nr:TlpA disulfide reductase family protein [Nitrospirota bacterium]